MKPKKRKPFIVAEKPAFGYGKHVDKVSHISHNGKLNAKTIASLKAMIDIAYEMIDTLKPIEYMDLQPTMYGSYGKVTVPGGQLHLWAKTAKGKMYKQVLKTGK